MNKEDGMESKTWDLIPCELLSLILQYVPFEDLVSSVQYVNSQWQAALNVPSFWNDVSFQPSLGMKSERVVELLKKCPLLKNFEFRKGLDCEQIYKALCNSNNKITNLSFNTVDIGSDIKHVLTSFRDLEYLQVPVTTFVVNDCLGKIPKLKTLKCCPGPTSSTNIHYWRQKGAEIEDNDWRSLQHIEFISDYTGEKLIQLMIKRGSQLQSLLLHFVGNPTALEKIPYCINLKELHLNFTSSEITKADVENFCDNLKLLTKMQSLKLISFVYQDAHVLSRAFSNTLFKDLTDIQFIACLALSPRVGKSVSDACPKLKCLNVQASTVDDEFLAEISKCHHLESLNLSGCKEVTEEGFRHLVKCTKLRNLNLDWVGFITAPAFNYIGMLKALCVLSVKYCTYDSLQLVATAKALPELKHLKVFGPKSTNGNFIQDKLDHCRTDTTGANPTLSTYVHDEGDLQIVLIYSLTQEIVDSLNLSPRFVKVEVDFLMRPCTTYYELIPLLQKVERLRGLVLKAFVNELNQLYHLFDRSSYPEMRELGIVHCMYVNATLMKRVTECCPNLESLDLRCCMTVNDEILATVIERLNLSSLDVTGCNGLTNSGLGKLTEMKNLKKLKLIGLKALNLKTLFVLQRSASLKELYLGYDVNTKNYLEKQGWIFTSDGPNIAKYTR